MAAMLVAASTQIHAQGFIYDQESTNSPVSSYANGVDGIYIQPATIFQTFIPTFSAIGFVQLEFEDAPNNGTNGATVYVNLWTGSPNINSATFVSSTTPVYMPDGFMNSGLGAAGVTNIFFSTLITLTAGQTYYLQPVVSSGDNPWAVVAMQTYPNGNLYYNGTHNPGQDLWFREGIISVPEPSVFTLVGLSSLLLFAFKRRSNFLSAWNKQAFGLCFRFYTRNTPSQPRDLL